MAETRVLLLSDVKVTGSMIDNRGVLVRVGLLDGATLSGVSGSTAQCCARAQAILATTLTVVCRISVQKQTASGSVVPETVWAPILRRRLEKILTALSRRTFPNLHLPILLSAPTARLWGPHILKPLNGRRWSVKTCWGATELVCRPWGHGADGTSNHFCADSVHL